MLNIRTVISAGFLTLSFSCYSQWEDPVLSSDSSISILQEKIAEQEKKEDTLEEAGSTFGARLDRSRDWLANSLNIMSVRMDNFFMGTVFGDDVFDNYHTGTHAQISLHSRHEIGYGTSYKVKANIKLVLPNTSERFNLIFQSEDEDDEFLETGSNSSVDDANYSAALRYVIKRGSLWKTDADIGVRWHNPPNPYARVRARRDIFLESWTWRIVASLYYYTSGGWDQINDIRIDYPINTEKLFRISVSSDYWVSKEYVDLKYGFTLYHELSPRSVLAYSAGASGDTQHSVEFDDYHAGVMYRHLIYRNWIYASVHPQFEWNAEEDYQTIPVIMFKLEALID